jgi:hydroxymethylglutaryl-CoA lyase/(R)-citramalyl-CoA lyase
MTIAGSAADNGVTICEVGPRDGLQNESARLNPVERAELCDRLAAAGLPRIEAASFVHPKLVPQMAGAEEVMQALRRRPGTDYAGLVLNERGFDRARAAGVDEIHYAFPVTESFARRNQNTSVEEGIQLAGQLCGRSRQAGLRYTVTLIVAFGCPFEGRVETATVLRVAEHVLELCQPDQVTLADTIGVAVPTMVKERMAGLRSLGVGRMGGHFHDTRNTGVANCVAALEAGVTVLDASVGGTGGCPFAPAATGNVPTEDVVYLLHGMGIQTGVNLVALIEVAHWLGKRLGKQLPGMVSRAGPFAPVAS